MRFYTVKKPINTPDDLKGMKIRTKMVNADVMKALGSRGVIVNVARGSVIDEQALIVALKSGTILAAGLDVFANEPTVPEEMLHVISIKIIPEITGHKR